MGIKGDYGQILSGMPIKVEGGNFAVSQPTVRDICAFGEDSFLACVVFFTKSDLMARKIREMGGNTLTIASDFQIVLSVIDDDQSTKQMVTDFFDFIFPNYIWKFETGCVQFKIEEDGPNVGQLNPMNFENFKQTLKDLFLPHTKGDEDEDYNPINDRAKEIAEKLKRGNEIRNSMRAKSGNSTKLSVFGTYISSLSVGLPMDISVLYGYTAFQLYDSFLRYMNKASYDLYQRVTTMPMMDTSKIKEPEHWTSDIY